MKNLKIKWGNVAFNLIVALLFSFVTGFNPVACFAGSMAIGTTLGFVPHSDSSVAFMAIQKEIWENDIVGNLFKNNEFILHAFNADQYVLQGKVVHIPNAGDTPNVEKNRSSLPADVKKRTDVDITYNLDEFTSDPILIPNADTVELSYDKRQSITAEAQAKLKQVVAEHMLRNWAPGSSNVIKTTGDAVTGTAPSATGNRKAVAIDDVKSVMTKLNKADVPQEDRYALFSAELYDQLISGMSKTQYSDFSRYFDAENGVLGKLYGFNIMMRSSGLVYNKSDAVREVGASGAATDNEAALFWQKNSVERALGTVKFFENIGDATFYGDIYSFLLRMGGRIRRNDNAGVIALAQDATT